MRPLCVVIVACVFGPLCMIPYFWLVPDTIDVKSDEQFVSRDLEGFWGLPDGSFNWCEWNYHVLHHVAEPANAFTSAVYVLISAMHLSLDRQFIPSHLALLCLSTLLMGVGSVLFHSSLKYWAQVLDEVPMLVMASLTAVVLYTRNDKTWYPLLRNYQLVSGAILALVLLLTDQESDLHRVARAYWCSFAVFFGVTFFLLCVAANECDDMVAGLTPSPHVGSDQGTTDEGKEPNAEKRRGKQEFAKLFETALLLFVVGMLGWSADNFWCQTLQELPMKIPYINLHAWAWHLCTCFGMHFVYLVLLAHHHLRQGADVKVGTKCAFIPWLQIKPSRLMD